MEILNVMYVESCAQLNYLCETISRLFMKKPIEYPVIFVARFFTTKLFSKNTLKQFMKISEIINVITVITEVFQIKGYRSM